MFRPFHTDERKKNMKTNESIELCELLSGEEYQLSMAGAQICVQKMQQAAVCNDQLAAKTAAEQSIDFYNRALDLIRQKLRNIDDDRVERQ